MFLKWHGFMLLKKKGKLLVPIITSQKKARPFLSLAENFLSSTLPSRIKLPKYDSGSWVK